MREIIAKLLKKLRRKTSENILDKLRSKGAKIGKGVILYSPETIDIDDSRPYLLSIGEYTKITKGTIILTHDYSLSVLRRKYGEWIGEGRKTIIGNNCFIGVNSIILMGSHIGDNVIVGAGSVVHGKFPNNVVIAGNPAKIICSLDDYYTKRKIKTKNEAIECARYFKETYGYNPKPYDMNSFKFLFTPRNKIDVDKYGIVFECTGDETLEVIKAFYESKPFWKNFDLFLKEAKLLEKEN